MNTENGGLDLNLFVKEELAAIETYRQALRKIKDKPIEVELRRIQKDHEDAVRLLQEIITAGSADPMAGRTDWRKWASSLEETSRILGKKGVIKALKFGEENSVREYENALRQELLDSRIHHLISICLLPKTRTHLPALEHFYKETSEEQSGQSRMVDEGSPN